jgi:hypothetical protein
LRVRKVALSGENAVDRFFRRACALALMRHVLRFGLVFMAVSLAACAANKPPAASAPMPVEPLLIPAPTPAVPSAGPSIVDHRPAKDKARDMHSLLITSCDYGISTLAEKSEMSSGPSRLRNEMAALDGDPWRGHTIEVRHYATYLNQKRALKNQVGAMYTGLIPYFLLKAGETCKENEMHGGWYAGTEIQNLLSPLIVEMSISVDGHIHNQRSVYSPRVGIDAKLRHQTDDTEVEQAMTKANRALLLAMGTSPGTQPLQTMPSKPSIGDPNEGFINMPSQATTPAQRR